MNIAKIEKKYIKALLMEQKNLNRKLRQIGTRLNLLNGSGSSGSGSITATNGRKKHHKMSAATKAKISKAQKAKWAAKKKTG